MSDNECQQEVHSIMKASESIMDIKGLEVTASYLSRKEEDRTAQLSKKQWRKLIKQKAKELADVVALMKKHELKGTPLNEVMGGLKNVSLTKKHQLPRAFLARDVIIGIETTVKLGWKVSILISSRKGILYL